MWKNRFRYTVILLGAVLFHTFYTRWFSWYVLLLALLLPILSLAAAVLARWGARVKLYLPQKVRRGDYVETEITVHNKLWWLPIPALAAKVEIQDQMTHSKEYVLSGLTKNVAYIDTYHCAVVRCSLTRCAVLDYLKLFRLPLRSPRPVTMPVMPIARQPEPAPELSCFRCVSYRVKRGGVSEVHELREYRPGDSMRDVHWKLSAKTGELVVREPQEPEHGTVLISCDIAESRKAMDSILDRVLWVSEWLLQNDIPHEVCWQDSETAAAGHTAHVADERGQQQAIAALLGSAAGGDILWQQSVPPGAWHYHVGIEQQTNDDEDEA